MTSCRLPCFPFQFRRAEQLFLLEPFNCYEAVALDSPQPRSGPGHRARAERQPGRYAGCRGQDRAGHAIGQPQGATRQSQPHPGAALSEQRHQSGAQFGAPVEAACSFRDDPSFNCGSVPPAQDCTPRGPGWSRACAFGLRKRPGIGHYGGKDARPVPGRPMKC